MGQDRHDFQSEHASPSELCRILAADVCASIVKSV